jgi:bifunctional enzyme CysN/CysC
VTHAPRSFLAPQTKPRLRFMTCGAVDDGKSTLIGRLLHDTGAVYEDHLAEALRAGGSSELDFSFLVDGLKAEREQGITIDVAYRYFATPARSFLIADAPGHEQYTRNQAAAASQTDAIVVLIDATGGIKRQTRRHLAIASLFGVQQVIAVVSKMDLVSWSQSVFVRVKDDVTEMTKALGADLLATIPVSARMGDNVARQSLHMPWYSGRTLIEALEAAEPRKDTVGRVFVPVRHVERLDGGGRLLLGSVCGARLSVGQEFANENGATGRISSLWSAGEAAGSATNGAAVALRLEPELDAGRGAVLVTPGHALPKALQVLGQLIWLGDEAMSAKQSLDLLVHNAETGITVSAVLGRVRLEDDAGTDGRDLAGALSAQPNDIVRVDLLFARPTVCLPFSESRTLGAFILVDRATCKTVAAGVIDKIERQLSDTPWQTLAVTPKARAARMGHRPLVIWLTGLSGAGKSTIADLLDRRLHALGRHTAVLDGDNLRHGLTADLGFSDADRRENSRRVAHTATLMADAGLIVIVSLISPFAQARAEARAIIGTERFVEIYVDAPLDVCRKRDPKGLYSRAEAGELSNFTGFASRYDVPDAPELHIRTHELSPEKATDQILETIDAMLSL